MVKVKGQISELAVCIVDSDERIAGLAKLFFHELAKKVFCVDASLLGWFRLVGLAQINYGVLAGLVALGELSSSVIKAWAFMQKSGV